MFNIIFMHDLFLKQNMHLNAQMVRCVAIQWNHLNITQLLMTVFIFSLSSLIQFILGNFHIIKTKCYPLPK